MGSPCSPALAIALCMRAEHECRSRHGKASGIIAGYRYVDDVLIYTTAGACLGPLSGMYAPMPLEVEQHSGSFRYLDTWNRLHLSGALDISHYHKNTARAHEGLPPLRNVVHFSSHVPSSRKYGVVVGALNRVVRATKAASLLPFCISRVMTEFYSFGMPKDMGMRAIRRVFRQSTISP